MFSFYRDFKAVAFQKNSRFFLVFTTHNYVHIFKKVSIYLHSDLCVNWVKLAMHFFFFEHWLIALVLKWELGKSSPSHGF